MITCKQCKLPLDLGQNTSMNCPRCGTLNTGSGKTKETAGNITCSKCRTVNKSIAKFCGNCGFTLSHPSSLYIPKNKPGYITCRHCNATNKDIAKFCGNCGRTF